VLARPAISSVLPNMLNEEQLQEFCEASDTPPLSDDEHARLEELYPSVFKNEEALAGSAR